MTLFIFLSLFLAFALALSAELPLQHTLAYLPLPQPASSATTPIPFCTLTYDPSSTKYAIASYNAPTSSKQPSDAFPDLARIGPISSSSSPSFSGHSTTLTSTSTLGSPSTSILRLTLKADFSILSVGITPASELQARSASTSNSLPILEVVYAAPEPKAVLNKPVQLNREGKLVKEEEQAEKGLLAKYWWVLAAIFLLTMIPGGGGEEGGGGGERK